MTRVFRAAAYYIRMQERRIVGKIRAHPESLAAKIVSAELIRFTEVGVARGTAVGMFWAFVPMPFQMVPAFLFCWLARANLPVAMACVWISNPFTYLPIFSAQYQIGVWVFGGGGGWERLRELAAAGNILTLFKTAGPVFYQGALLTSVAMMAAGYFAGLLMFYFLRKSKKLAAARRRRKNKRGGIHADAG